jgi:hypothetical protein
MVFVPILSFIQHFQRRLAWRILLLGLLRVLADAFFNCPKERAQ